MKIGSLIPGSARFVLILLVLVSPWIGYAQSTVNEPAERKAQLSYVGSKGDSAVLLLEIKNEKAEKVFVYIQQKDGQILYRETFTDKNVNKKFFMPREVATEVTFVVSDAKDRNRQEFQLNSRLVEELYISKAD